PQPDLDRLDVRPRPRPLLLGDLQLGGPALLRRGQRRLGAELRHGLGRHRLLLGALRPALRGLQPQRLPAAGLPLPAARLAGLPAAGAERAGDTRYAVLGIAARPRPEIDMR